LAIFKQSIEADQMNIDYVWRLLFALGMVPAVCTVYSRFSLPESAQYAKHVLKNAELVEKGKAYALGKDFVDSNPSSISRPIINQNASSSGRSHLKEFFSYFSHWHNFKILLGTCSTWFLLDIAFYGLSLNQSVVLSAIGFAPDSATSPWETLFKQAVGNLIITLLGALPGYYVTVFTVERLGRKTIQIIGFTMEIILFTIVAAAYYPLKERTIAVFIILFVLIQFFFQFGANATRFRATAHGLSAACGKAGAILAAFGFNVLVDLGGKNAFLPETLGIFAAIQFIGLIATIWLIPETKGKNLDDFENNEHPQESATPINTYGDIE
jgi:PHS family inorganic phosphate transporter-like MFS transporter